MATSNVLSKQRLELSQGVSSPENTCLSIFKKMVDNYVQPVEARIWEWKFNCVTWDIQPARNVPNHIPLDPFREEFATPKKAAVLAAKCHHLIVISILEAHYFDMDVNELKPHLFAQAKAIIDLSEGSSDEKFISHFEAVLKTLFDAFRCYPLRQF